MMLIPSLVRAALMALAASLASHGYIKPEESSALVDQLLPAVIALGTIAWSAWEKNGQAKLLEAARTLPQNVPIEAVKQKAKTL